MSQPCLQSIIRKTWITFLSGMGLHHSWPIPPGPNFRGKEQWRTTQCLPWWTWSKWWPQQDVSHYNLCTHPEETHEASLYLWLRIQENLTCLFVFNRVSYYNFWFIYLEPCHDLYFWRSTLQNKACSNQNKGHLGSSYMYIYILYPGTIRVSNHTGRLLSSTMIQRGNAMFSNRLHWSFKFFNPWIPFLA